MVGANSHGVVKKPCQWNASLFKDLTMVLTFLKEPSFVISWIQISALDFQFVAFEFSFPSWFWYSSMPSCFWQCLLLLLACHFDFFHCFNRKATTVWLRDTLKSRQLRHFILIKKRPSKIMNILHTVVNDNSNHDNEMWCCLELLTY